MLRAEGMAAPRTACILHRIANTKVNGFYIENVICIRGIDFISFHLNGLCTVVCCLSFFPRHIVVENPRCHAVILCGVQCSKKKKEYMSLMVEMRV